MQIFSNEVEVVFGFVGGGTANRAPPLPPHLLVDRVGSVRALASRVPVAGTLTPVDAVVHSVPLARLVALGPPLGEPDHPHLATFDLLGPPPAEDAPAAVAARVQVPAASVQAAPGASWPVPPGALLRLEYAANVTQAAAVLGAVGVRVLGPAEPADGGGA